MKQEQFENVKSVFEQYGGSLTDDQYIIAPDGKVKTTYVVFQKGRLQVRGRDSGYCLFSGPGAKSAESFAKKFWA